MQRVSTAKVVVDEIVVGEIGKGILLLLGVDKNDTEKSAEKLINKVLNYRLFADDEEKMNLSLRDIGAELLVVSQFTLSADTKKGLRPSFSTAAEPANAEKLYDYFVATARRQHKAVSCGKFGASMQVHLINDGPVTFLLDV